MARPQISFCVALKDRSRVEMEAGLELALFPNCISSLARACAGSGVLAELVVADFDSSDKEFAQAAVAESGLVCDWLSLDGGFCRGLGLNAAAATANSQLLFFLDADMLIGAEVVRRAVELVAPGVAYFPWCLSYSDPGHEIAWERREGWGQCGVDASDFSRLGPIHERGEWGHEDVHFVNSLALGGVEIIRERGQGLFHQWHPNDRGWKNRFARGNGDPGTSRPVEHQPISPDRDHPPREALSCDKATDVYRSPRE